MACHAGGREFESRRPRHDSFGVSSKSQAPNLKPTVGIFASCTVAQASLPVTRLVDSVPFFPYAAGEEVGCSMNYPVPRNVEQNIMWNNALILCIIWNGGTVNRKFDPESLLLQRVLDNLSDRFPATWSICLRGEKRSVSKPWSAVAEVKNPEGEQITLVIEVKNFLQPREVTRILQRGEPEERENILLVARYLSPRTRELLTRSGANYADDTGNIRLSLDKPAVFIETTGVDKNPWPGKQVLSSLKGPASARVIRGLCDLFPPYGVRELSERIGVPPSSVSRVTSILERDALITRDAKNRITDVMWKDLIKRWTQDYSPTASGRFQSYVAPRGLTVVQNRLKDWSGLYAVTGSFAVDRLTAAAPSRLMMVYSDSPARLAEYLELTVAERGANLILIEPLDQVVFERMRSVENLQCCAVSQVAADLLTNPGRGPAEGEELLRWMEENEIAWRL